MGQATGSAWRWTQLLAALTVTALVAACGEDEIILPGERLDVRAPLDPEAEVPEPADRTPREVALSLPSQVNHQSWSHTNGSVQHRIQHPALGTNPQRIWSADIGAGSDRKRRITATPVAADGRIFTLDALARVSAVSTSGAVLWTRDLTPPREQSEEASGGGLAVVDGTLYVTSAFGFLTAFDAATGDIRWQQKLDAAATAPPTVSGGIAYLVGRDSVAWAIDTRNGRVLWSLPGTPSGTGYVGGGAPALTDRLAILPFPSAEITGVLRQSGIGVWGGAVSGQRLGRAYAAFSDITGDPVIVGNTIYAGNASGRTAAINAANGDRIWTADEGATSPVWPVGNTLFLVSDLNELVRLDSRTGEVVWAVPLPKFVDEKVRRRKSIYAHYGPVLAGGRLWVASNDEVLRGFSPSSGALTAQIELPGGAASAPIVVNQTLYVVSQDGELHAYR
ncbi:PQQ-binding-like beta-propeller repeat protein [Tropicimonas sp. S265A]|uniref:PQQ-like beta-propeller repeat protein n=1 Tax=Tropicimonas sp. S265A TaxID=3415134 RepID=UPI003C7DDE7D